MEKQKTVKEMAFVLTELSTRTLLEQMAEEAAEVSQAALKLIRARGNGNPTPMDAEEAWEWLEEEMSDLFMCATLLNLDLLEPLDNPKWERWAERIRSGV